MLHEDYSENDWGYQNYICSRLFSNPAELAEKLSTTVVASLADACDQSGRASIAFSGGSTPKRFFQHFATQSQLAPLLSSITMTLVDERSVPFESDRSNTRMLFECLINRLQPAPNFLPLFEKGQTLEEVNARVSSLQETFDVVILGMGVDGHTASFFPNADGLEKAVSIDANNAIEFVGGDLEDRITWTLPHLVNAKRLILHIEGEQKKAVLTSALADLRDSQSKFNFDDKLLLPIARVIKHRCLLAKKVDATRNMALLEVFYCS